MPKSTNLFENAASSQKCGREISSEEQKPTARRLGEKEELIVIMYFS